MIRPLPVLAVALTATVLLLPATSRAQTFKVEKWDIGGTGSTDYVMAEPGTGRVFVSRGTHVMVVDGMTGKVLGDIPDTPRMHGIALAPKSGHGFTTNAGDSTLTMFDIKTLAVIKKVKTGTRGLDGIMYDDGTDKIILTNHSTPGTVMAVDPVTGNIVGTVNLTDNGPEGAASDGKGKLFVNLEGKNSIEVVDSKTWKSIGVWDIKPCEGPTGIAIDRTTNRIFAGCNTTSVVVDAASGKVVAQISNGTRVDALGWDQSQKLIYIPVGAPGNVVVAHEDSPDKYTTVATVTTMAGAKTITVDPVSHRAYLFQPGGGGNWFFAISH